MISINHIFEGINELLAKYIPANLNGNAVVKADFGETIPENVDDKETIFDPNKIIKDIKDKAKNGDDKSDEKKLKK